MDGPVIGPSGETVVIGVTVGPDGVRTDKAAKIAKVTRRYRRLNKSEQDLIRELARKKLASFVQRRQQQVRKKYASDRRKARQEPERIRRRIAEAQGAGQTQKVQSLTEELKKASATAEQQIAQINTKEKREVANPWGDLDIGASGGRKSGIGIVIENAERKPVVALVDISAGGAITNVDAFAYEIDQFGSQDQLVAAVRSTSERVVVDNNRKNYLISDTVTTAR